MSFNGLLLNSLSLPIYFVSKAGNLQPRVSFKTGMYVVDAWSEKVHNAYEITSYQWIHNQASFSKVDLSKSPILLLFILFL